MTETDVMITKFGKEKKCQLCPGKAKKPKRCVQATVDGKTGIYCLPHLEVVLTLAYGMEEEDDAPILDAIENGKSRV